jgi:DNA-binding transcriptional LysR family regulator
VTWTFVPAETGQQRGVDPITVAVNGPLGVNNSEALRDAAIAGLGIALLPDFSAQSALEKGQLVEVLPGWQSTGAFGEWLYAIRPYSAHVPRVTQVFVEYLRDAFRSGFQHSSAEGAGAERGRKKSARTGGRVA